METVLAATILCLAGAVAALASIVPFLYWKSFTLEARLAAEIAELGRQIDILDQALAKLLEGVAVPTKEQA